MKTAQEYYQEFLALKDMPIPQRARGFKLTRIVFWQLNLFIVVIVLAFPVLKWARSISEVLFLAFGLAIGWLVWLLPEQFFYEEYRRKRHLKRKYPQVHRAVLRLRNKGESILWDIPPLYIEGKPYFLVSYFFRQRWWERRPWVRLTGWMLFDAAGNPVQDAQLFAKAFVTMAYADEGAIATQDRSEQLIIELRFALKKYLPRAERLLKRKEEFLRSEGLAYEWQELMKRFPLFYEAVKDSVTFYDVRIKFAKAVGYSFGYEFYYEDAVHMEKVYRAYGEYMRLRYLQDLITALDPHLVKLWREARWNFIDRYVLNMLGQTLHMVIKQFIWFPLDDGKPTVSEWEAYVQRLEVARQKGFRIIANGDLPEKYPFKGALYHTDPFENRSDNV